MGTQAKQRPIQNYKANFKNKNNSFLSALCLSNQFGPADGDNSNNYNTIHALLL